MTIKSQKTNFEVQRKNKIAQQEAQEVNFQSAGDKRSLSFFDLAKSIRKSFVEAVILDKLRKEKTVLRKYDTMNGGLSLILILLYIVEYEMFISDNGKPKYSSTAVNHLFRFVMLGLSSCVCVVQYYHYDSLLKIQKILKLKDQRETLTTSGFLKYLILECCINAIICPPFVDFGFEIDQLKGSVYITIDSTCFMICLFRFYNVLKVPEQYSIWTTEESTKICKQFKFTPNIPFLIKAELARRPYIAVFSSLFIAMILFGLGVRIFEVCYVEKNSNSSGIFFEGFVNTFWFIIVTMVTVGYGDGFPKTHIGRFMALWVGVVGTLLVSLMVVALSNSSALSNGEVRAFHKIDIKSLKTEAQNKAANFLYRIFQMYLSNKQIRDLEEHGERQAELNKLVLYKFGLLSQSKSMMVDFKAIHFKFSTSTSTPEDLILDLLDKNEQKFREVFSQICKLNFISENCLKIIENQKIMTKAIEQVVNDQHRIAAFIVKVNLLYQSNTA